MKRRQRRTVRILVLLILAGSEVGSTSSSKFVGEFWFVVGVAVDDLVMGLSLIRVYDYY